jgi:hypothetical protein
MIMNGAEFFRCVERIVGADNAALYASKFGPLDDFQFNNLLNYEALAFYVYTTSLAWHAVINRELWEGHAREEVLIFKDVLNAALEKLPRYTAKGGVVYRGYTAADLGPFLANYRRGTLVVFPGFTSASFEADEAYGGNGLFIIRALTARAAWYVSANFHECEVLLPTDRSFLVLEVEQRGDQAVVNLEEQPS